MSGGKMKEAERGEKLKDKMLPCGRKMALLATRLRKGTLKFVNSFPVEPGAGVAI